jgi:hypothetical protein
MEYVYKYFDQQKEHQGSSMYPYALLNLAILQTSFGHLKEAKTVNVFVIVIIDFV